MDGKRQIQAMPPAPQGAMAPAPPTMPAPFNNGPQYQQQQVYPPVQQQPFFSNPFMMQQQYGMQGHMPYWPQMMPQGLTNRNVSQKIQGVYSTYPARLKQSDDNALLLPSSYLANKKARFATESDEEFDEFVEESDEGGTPSSGVRTRSAAAAAAAAGASTTPFAPGNQTLAPPTKELRKVVRKKNHIYVSEQDLERASQMEEVLVPIRLDIDMDDIRLRDVFLWNMNGTTTGADCSESNAKLIIAPFPLSQSNS